MKKAALKEYKICQISVDQFVQFSEQVWKYWPASLMPILNYYRAIQVLFRA